MSYASNAELPGPIRDEIPEEAQTIYREAFNAAEKKYANGIQGIMRWIAWAAVKKAYKRVNENWIKISEGA